MGVLKWVDQTVSDPTYFEKQMDNTPLHLTLLDEVGFLSVHFSSLVFLFPKLIEIASNT